MIQFRLMHAIVALFLTTLINGPVLAADGRLELNQACVSNGCFPGDTSDFPIQITQAGSYVLTSNIDVSANVAAIEILDSNVVLDLNGFNVSGPGSGNSNGITMTSVLNVEVRNGTVQNFGGSGLACATSCHGLRIIELHALNNQSTGIAANGSERAIVRNAVVNGNYDGIFFPGSQTQIEGCKVTNHQDLGIRAGPNSIVRNNIVSVTGNHGIQVGNWTSVIGNVVTFADFDGIALDTSALVKNNVADQNNQVDDGYENIETCGGCTLIDNHAPAF